MLDLADINIICPLNGRLNLLHGLVFDKTRKGILELFFFPIHKYITGIRPPGFNISINMKRLLCLLFVTHRYDYLIMTR